MPKKGEVCRLGSHAEGFKTQLRNATEPLRLPREARRFLRCLDDLPVSIREAFDGCARLYQVAAIVGGQFPSVGMAYRVASVDALSRGFGSGFKDYVRDSVKPKADLESTLDLMWGSVRSSRLHGGTFAAGEYEALRVFDPVVDSATHSSMLLPHTVSRLLREAIVTGIGRFMQGNGLDKPGHLGDAVLTAD